MKKIILVMLLFTAAIFVFSSQSYAISSALNISDDFLWDGEDINVYYDKDLEKFVTDFVMEDHKIENGGVDYFVSTTGSDSNDGLTLETALASIKTAMLKSDVETVYIDTGVYNRETGFYGVTFDGIDVNLVGLSDDVVITVGANSASWTKTDGYTNIYNFSRTAVNDIRDSAYLDSDGEWAQYTLLTDMATVDATAGSYFYDGTIVYIHPFESRVADIDIHLMFLAQNLRVENSTIYLENIKLYGGALVFRPISSTVFMNNVEIKYASTYNGLQAEMSDVYSQDVVASHNKADGLNYHNTDTVNRHYAIEIDCIGNHNGITATTDINNGSTSHEKTSVIRVNGDYHDNNGPNIIDVGEAQSMNYGTNSYDSVANNPENIYSNINYAIDGTTGYNKMWLVNVLSTGSDYDYSIAMDQIYDLTYYYVAFDTNGGVALNDLFVNDGTVVTTPPLTGKTGYTFYGWYLDETLSNPIDLTTTAITQDYTLYARWVPQTGSYATIGTTQFSEFELYAYGLLIGLGIFVLGYYFYSDTKKKGKSK